MLRYIRNFLCFVGVCSILLFIVVVVAYIKINKKRNADIGDPFYGSRNYSTFFYGNEQDDISEKEFFISIDLGDERLDDEVSFIRYLIALERAITDDRVKGIVMKLDDANVPLSNVYEISKVLQRFKKPIYSYGSNISNSAYLLACNSNTIYMHPCGLLNLTGTYVSVPFMKKLFEKLGVSFHVEKRENYKTYADTYSEYKMSSYQRESLQAIIKNRKKLFHEQLSLRRIVKSDDIINNGPYSSKTALLNKLVDNISSYPETLKNITEEMKFVCMARYSNEYISEKSEKNICVICLYGVITDDYEQAAGDVLSRKYITLRDVRRLIKGIRDSKKEYAAYIIRINSPGGSAIASEDVLCELKKHLKGKNVPVYISMGDYAASGGYWIVCGLSKNIFATPYTLTGSIGVVSVTPNIVELMSKLGINAEKITSNTSSSFGDIMYELSYNDKLKYSKIVDSLYDLFLHRVSEGRQINLNETKKVAKGRVWPGEEALRLKLVDRIGGFLDVVDTVKRDIKCDNVCVDIIEEDDLSIFSMLKSKIKSFVIKSIMTYFNIGCKHELILQAEQL